jgi:hypothetical protein
MNTEFYRGLVWKELGPRFNDRIVDIGNVLLLRPLAPGRGLVVLPAVDGVAGGGEAPGIVVLQIFAVKAGGTEAAARQAEDAFTAYRAAGAHEAGVLVTLDAPNNFPRLPVRTDGPHLVWVGVVKDEATLETRLAPLMERTARSLDAQGLLRGAPELVLLDPTLRSRLRWRAEWR